MPSKNKGTHRKIESVGELNAPFGCRLVTDIYELKEGDVIFFWSFSKAGYSRGEVLDVDYESRILTCKDRDIFNLSWDKVSIYVKED